jgi:hypothetical protein
MSTYKVPAQDAGSPSRFLNIPGLARLVVPGFSSVTEVRRGTWLVNTATALLFALGGGLLYVSFRAQFVFIFATKHASRASIIEALALDAGMVIFSLLALGLARSGQNAKVERVLILACAVGSSVMNYAASDAASIRSVLVYVMPPLFLAVVTDRVIAGIRRHWTGDSERSAWSVAGYVTGKAALYSLRTILAPRESLKGIRRYVLESAPLPQIPAPVKVLSIGSSSQESEALNPGHSARTTAPSLVVNANSVNSGSRSRRGSQVASTATEKAPSKKDSLLALYRAHGAYGDREKASRIASELAPQVGLQAGTARTYIYAELASMTPPGNADQKPEQSEEQGAAQTAGTEAQA